ncbi:hybrid sensor histidine kinase/response regulator [Pseudomonas asplenii]|uniref:hybrid sensor histidine kinase/response regulator n=1 Tax=Pseudomonas asplenii TaxID=53407 RepID=UPI0006B4A87D|nr:hybrid sensor histidine kinase/response regulator [Pseudomonas fuscovaginae]KPA95727.1 PAS domain S-box [Pseudomonas fuscovaginae]
MNRFHLYALNGRAITLLVIGLVATFVGCQILQNTNEQRAREALANAADSAVEAVVGRLQKYQYGLRGARGAIVASGEENLTRETFHRYSLTRDVPVEFPGARGFGFIRRVPAQDLEQFLQRARDDSSPSFSIRQFAPHEGDLYVIQYLEPNRDQAVAIGLDIASQPDRAEAARMAARTGEVRLTSPITLVQAVGKPKQSFLILLPIYRSGIVPKTESEREAEVVGWSYAPLMIESVLAGLVPESEAINLRLRDITGPGPAVAFYQTAQDAEAATTGLPSRTLERDIYGRRWQIELQALPLFIERLHQVSPLVVFVLGTLASVLVAALVAIAGVSSRRRLQVLSEQRRLALIVESSADAIIGTTLDGVVTNWNRGARKLLGYTAQEAVGQPLLKLIVPPGLAAEEAEILRRIALGETIVNLDTVRHSKDGRSINVSANVSPICDESGAVIGSSKILRDITAHKAAEARILELNANLEEQVAERTSELRRINLLFSSVLRSASRVAIIATDLDGVISLFNEGAEQMLGYRAAQLVGKATPTILHLEQEIAERSAELSREYGQAIEGFRVFAHKPEFEHSEIREWTYVHKDGRHVPVNLVVTSLRDEQGTLTGYLSIAIDITERKVAEHQLDRSLQSVRLIRDQLLMAADVAELGIWTWTLADGTLQWNERMFEFYSQPLSLKDNGLTYAHWYERVHPDDAEAVAAQLAAAVAGEGVYDPVFRVLAPDGRIRIIQAGAQIERDAQGQPLRVTGINRDITTQRELEAHLLQARDRADSASAAKSFFLANMSHEIRTPMNAVLGMLQLVQHTELNARQRDYVVKAQTAAKSLLGLLNDILDYSKIEAGKLRLDLHTFELEALMRDLAVVLAGNQGSKEVEVMFDLDSELPGSLVGDSMRLQQVLINLAGNALKFTQQGQVVVSLRQLQRLEGQVQLRVEVCDTGIGISAEQQQRIFEGFTQAEASTTRRFGGTGLGLVICKRLVGLMGGELLVESEEGSGSRFWFDITLDVARTEPLRLSCPGVDSQMRLLVADDNSMACELLLRTVRSLGWTADTVDGGTRAVESVRNAQMRGEPYDVVLMDWRMPDMDGLSAARLISLQEQSAPPPMVIMITAYGREVLADVHHEGDAPFVGFLTKPVTPLQLADAVQRAFSSSEAVPEVRPGPVRQRRLAGMRLLVVEDNALNRQVADELLRGEGAQVVLAEGGLEGVSQVFCASTPFDAVLMDIQMPDIDGMEATRRIRRQADFASLPILAMTANASSSDREACLAAGMNDHVSKPIDLEELVLTLRLQTGRETSQPKVLEAAGGVADTVLEARQSIMARFGGNLELISTVLYGFGAELEKQLSLLPNHLQDRDGPALAAVLHAIKGSSGTMGAQALSQRAGALERELMYGDAAAIARVLDDPQWLPELRQLLARSVDELQATFGNGYRGDSARDMAAGSRS